MRKKPFDYRKKTILLKKFKEDYKEELEVKQVAEKMQVQADKIVVKKVSFASKALEIIIDLIYRLGKIIIVLLFMIFMSAGATAIFNEQIRDILFNYLPFFK